MRTVLPRVSLLQLALLSHVTTIINARFGDLEGRIVGGRPAMEGEAPYQLSLMRERHLVCGATLILSPCTHKFHLGITAAHCVCDVQTLKPHAAEEYSIRGGSLSKYAGTTQYIKKIVIHEGYNGTYHDDIALLFFEKQFTLDKNLKAVDLPNENTKDEEISELIVSGWGNLNESGHSETDLHIARLPIITNEECDNMYKSQFHQHHVIPPTSMCAGLPGGAKDACFGDSGGPGVAVDSKGKYLAGVISWGKGCARAQTPGVYMRVSKYMEWIVSNTEPNNCANNSEFCCSDDDEEVKTYFSTSGLVVHSVVVD